MKKTAREKGELQNHWGVRYSELLRLPYCDIDRHHSIDPMHNLLLGTAKNMISKHHYDSMQEIIDAIRIPTNMVRIPYKILLNVCNTFNSSSRTCQVLVHFVEACSVLLKPVLTSEDVTEGDDKLIAFCTEYETLYGPHDCTPNMHLHLHLKECLLDYGPVHVFWFFPFERCNGIFQTFQKNWICPEPQIVAKFVSYQDCIMLQGSCKDQEQFMWLGDMNRDNHHPESLQQTKVDASKLHSYYQNALCCLDKIDATDSLLQCTPKYLPNMRSYFPLKK